MIYEWFKSNYLNAYLTICLKVAQNYGWNFVLNILLNWDGLGLLFLWNWLTDLDFSLESLDYSGETKNQNGHCLPKVITIVIIFSAWLNLQILSQWFVNFIEKPNLSWDQFERLIVQFKFRGTDTRSRPPVVRGKKMKVKQSRKVIGTFSEVAQLIRSIT